MRTARLISWAAVAILLSARNAGARSRPLFEPTDLEMEAPGKVELDLQFGTLRSDTAWRTAVPDFELDIGIWPGVEIDIDGAYAIEGPEGGAFGLDHVAPDALWVAAKLGVYDKADVDTSAGWAVGAQLGPRLPIARDAHGLGYEALLLLDRHWSDTHLVLNVGGFVDPGAQITGQRPVGVEAGLDLSVDLPGSGFALSGELAGVRFLSADPHQLHATAGIAWAATKALDVSLIGLVGLLRGGDRGGVFVGFSPKLALWR